MVPSQEFGFVDSGAGTSNSCGFPEGVVAISCLHEAFPEFEDSLEKNLSIVGTVHLKIKMKTIFK